MVFETILEGDDMVVIDPGDAVLDNDLQDEDDAEDQLVDDIDDDMDDEISMELDPAEIDPEED